MAFAGRDSQTWEPRTPEEWIRADPLGPSQFPLWGASRVYAPDILFETWQRLPDIEGGNTWVLRRL